MLSNRMTAKRREEKPAIQARSNTVKMMRLLKAVLELSLALMDLPFAPACTISPI